MLLMHTWSCMLCTWLFGALGSDEWGVGEKPQGGPAPAMKNECFWAGDVTQWERDCLMCTKLWIRSLATLHTHTHACMQARTHTLTHERRCMHPCRHTQKVDIYEVGQNVSLNHPPPFPLAVHSGSFLGERGESCKQIEMKTCIV